MSEPQVHPAIAAREKRISDLLAWATEENLSKGYADLNRFDRTTKYEEIRGRLKMRAMSEFSVSSRLASEYADVVIEKIGLNGVKDNA